MSIPFAMTRTPRAAEAAGLAGFDESLQRREAVLAASARASRLLLQAPDAMPVMQEALRLLGEAAEADRAALALAEVGPNGERWLVIKSEWIADGWAGEACLSGRIDWDDRRADCCFCPELKTGRSVFVRGDGTARGASDGITAPGAKSSIIVPILVDGAYAGAIGFDDCHEARDFEPAVVSGLEIAAGIIGAALYREQLMDTMRREREQAAEMRVAELARANAALRANLERLASEPDPHSFLEQVLLEATRQLHAAGGSILVLDTVASEWVVVAHVRNGQLAEPSFAKRVPTSAAVSTELMAGRHEPEYFERARFGEIGWPGTLEYHEQAGHEGLYAMPLVFGDSPVGFIALSFREHVQLGPERIELLIALAQQATLAIALKRLAYSAKASAVLAERNRIGQEIHDGLAQGFTGILMQLAAAEEHMGCAKHSPLPGILARIRDLARDGLADARRSVLALRPDQARSGGLELALRQLAERSTVAARLVCSFEGSMGPAGPAPEHQHELLRIAQEAVSNAVRHASAKTIRIELREETEHWTLAVMDDGRGMDVTELQTRAGFGIANMRERARAIGGRCDIRSQRGRGTEVRVRLPRSARR